MNISDPIQTLSGVGPKRASALQDMGIVTIDNLLHHYPNSHVFARFSMIPDFREGDMVVFQAVVHTITKVKHFFIIKLTDNSHYTTKCVFFNISSVRSMLTVGREYWFWGKVTLYRKELQLSNPRFGGRAPTGIGDSGSPVYPATKAVTSDMIAALVRQVLKSGAHDELGNDTPDDMLSRCGAIEAIHFPEDKKELQRARKTLKYVEIRQVLKRMDRDKQRAKLSKVSCMVGGVAAETPFDAIEPFDIEFTDDQIRATIDIERDLNTHGRMNRLLQGDTGCGKTAVAQWASLYVANCGQQTVVMCPTLALARQHYESWSKLFAGTGFVVSLRTSASGGVIGYKYKPEYADVVIGTTSILSIGFPNLGLLIVDEEHKFGKDQKDKLYHKYGTNRLLMTATPIPAALTATLFADLDVTTIRAMPAGRGKRHTYVLLPGQSAVKAGGQIYEVFPRIEGVDGVEAAFEDGRFDDLNAQGRDNRGLVHGDMSPEHNRITIRDFNDGSINRIYCTSMLEVGIDNPNANTIIIHDANMFGLSQLHQMRGRVGRGTGDSFCYLLLDTDDEAAHDRVRFLETCDDGFEVAEKDLELRGPGELAGNRQTGLTEFKLVDLVSDYGLIKRVKKDLGL